MGQRLRALALLVVLLGAGVLLGSSLAQWWQITPSLPVRRPTEGIQGRVRVEVLNAGGVSGVARDATARLRDLGLDVVYYGNAKNFSGEPSVVLDRGGRLDAARAVAEALGISGVVSEPDSGLYVDVTVRLGPEWSLETVPASEEPGTLRWWDPRGLFRKKETNGARLP